MVTIAAAASFVTVLVGLVTNLVSSQQKWPSWLTPIQHHPWVSFVLLGGLAVALTIAFSLISENGQKRSDRHTGATGWLPSQPTLIGDVPSKPAGYRERRELFANLKQIPGNRDASIVRSLTGMLGVGKTALAAEYARARHADGWRLVAWINASDETAVLSGLAQVASDLGLMPEGSDARAAGRALRRGLETDGDRCLLIFNDAGDLDALLPFLPAVGGSQVLITTTEQAAANLGSAVRVDVFTQQEALAFLSARTKPEDSFVATQVASELGYLPLALAQAAAVIAGEGLSYRTYLERLPKLPIDKSLTREPGEQYRRGTVPAIRLSLRVVGELDGMAVSGWLMETVSVLSPAGVPRQLLRAAGRSRALTSEVLPGGASDEDVDKALWRLAGSSLLTFSLDRQRVSAHRLVMRVVRESTNERRLADVCIAVGEVLIEQASAVREAWEQSAVRDLTEQIKALCAHIANLPAGADDAQPRCMLKLRLERARFLDDLGDFPMQAVEDGRRLFRDAQDNLGDDDPITLTCRHNLAVAYQQAGQERSAITEYEQNLADRVRLLGPDHADTLASRNNLATAYQDVRQIEQAIAEYERNLADRVRTLEPDHPDTLASRNNLATAYQDAGRVWQAIALHEKNLKLDQPILGGHDNARTLRITDLRLLHERTRADGNRTIRAGHPDYLGYRNNLATAYLEAGRVHEATVLLERTCEEKVQILGPNHPSTLVSWNNLAIAYLEAGRIRRAITLLDKVSIDSDRILTPDHRITQTIGENLASAHATTAIAYRLHRMLSWPKRRH